MTSNDHIREFLRYYCNLNIEPQYAVLLTGAWGSGKTWLIKDFIENHLDKTKKTLYLSLYGVQTFSDIESELFRLLHPVLGSKPARVLGRLFRGVLKTSINFDIDGDGKPDGSVSGGIPTEKILETVSIGAGHILVFDDLERCSIPIADLMGYVNQFVEHFGVKAILIANEHELFKSDEKNGSHYALIKEKLIGRTFEIAPEVASALEHFAAELPSGKAQDVVRKNVTLITRTYEYSRYKNLRLVRHALWDFDRISKALDPTLLTSDPLLVDLLALFLTYSFEVRSGAIKVSELHKLKDSWMYDLQKSEGKDDPDRRFHEIRGKYSGLNLYTTLVTDSAWEVIFSTGSIPSVELKESLLSSKYFQAQNQSNWVKLWYGTDLTDTEFDSVLLQVESEWDSRAYKQLEEVVHVAGLFVRYAKHGIYRRTVEDVIDVAKTYINQLVSDGSIPIIQPNMRSRSFKRESYAGLGFASLDDPKFCELFDYIDGKLTEAFNSSLPVRAKELLNLIGTETELFYRRITLNNDQDNLYYKTPILHLISMDDFVERLLSTTQEQRKIVAYALSERYRIGDFHSELMCELDWLKDMAVRLRNEISSRSGKVSGLALQEILDPYIMQSIDLLERKNPATEVAS